MIRKVGRFTVALVAMTCGGAFAHEYPTPGGVEKKYVGLYFDVFNTTPSNILANADQFAESTPYLDGVAIGLNKIPVTTPEGTVVTSAFYRIMHPTQRWTREAIGSQLPYLREIAKKPNLKESMLLFWMTPHRGSRIDWADDKGWANYAENMANVAWLAKEAGLKGLMLDPEEYDAQGGYLAQYLHTWKDPSFSETAKLARQRGREVFSRVFKEFPDAVIWSLWCFHKFAFWMDGGRQPYPVNNVDQSGELLHHYLNGMLDVMPPSVRIVEGTESYRGSALNNSYMVDAFYGMSASMALTAPENFDKMRSQFYFSNTHYIDMYRKDAKPNCGWYQGPVRGSRLEHLRINLEQSLHVATKYIWLYGEGNGKLFNWRNGHYAKKKTWEEQIPGLTETIMLVKNPLGFAAKRKAELAKEGKLVNLAKDIKGFVFERDPNKREFRQKDEERASVKNVIPGEKFFIKFKVSQTTRNFAFIDGAATPRVYWKKNGKIAPIDPVAIKMPDKPVRERGYWGFYPVEAEVVVPKGADELVLDLAAALVPDQRVLYRSMQIDRLFELSEKLRNAKGGKWKFDEKTNVLTDGNWKLSAKLNKKAGTLVVKGDNAETVGSGVLDLTGVKADTGYTVVGIGKLNNILSMTALYAPDVTGVYERGITGCSNVADVVVGEIKTHSSFVTPVAKRIGRLKTLGLIPAQLGKKVPSVDYRNRFVSYEGAPHDIAVKGVKPGELYTVGLSMKRRGPGYVFLYPRFRGNGEKVKSNVVVPQIVMTAPREDDVWQSGEVVVRVPEGADEIYIDVQAEITAGHTRIELKDFKVYKIGEPLPVWPEEALREKGWKRK